MIEAWMRSVQTTAAAERGVDRGENNDHDVRADVNPERLHLSWPRAGDHFVGEDERDSSDIQARAGGEHARHQKHAGCSVLSRRAETRGQVFVDRVNFIVVIRLDEDVADENPRDDRTERELHVSVIAEREPFAGRAEECRRAGLRRDNRGEHRPPRNAPPSEREVMQAILLPAHTQADENDDREVGE
jgi:hypothetical protein